MADSPGPRLRGFQALMQKLWWFHSFFALFFGVVVMAFARKGLAHADKVLVALALSWALIFVAFRFIVGPANRKPEEHFAKTGVRVVTNYVIKQMYQQMFFFLVPLYASSAIWSLRSPNWWIVPLLLVCAVISTMDLVFDNFIMEKRNIAAGMYGLCMFAVLNVLLPLTFRMPHFRALMIAAAITPAAVALLSYPVATVVRGPGLGLVALSTTALLAACYVGRAFVPPAPMAMAAGGLGHGAPGVYECVPGPLRTVKREQFDTLRCVSEITEPGGINDDIVHVWSHEGKTLLTKVPTRMKECPGEVFKSEFAATALPAKIEGTWSCRVETVDGQLLGLMAFEVPEEPLVQTPLLEAPPAEASPLNTPLVESPSLQPQNLQPSLPTPTGVAPSAGSLPNINSGVHGITPSAPGQVVHSL